MALLDDAQTCVYPSGQQILLTWKEDRSVRPIFMRDALDNLEASCVSRDHAGNPLTRQELARRLMNGNFMETPKAWYHLPGTSPYQKRS